MRILHVRSAVIFAENQANCRIGFIAGQLPQLIWSWFHFTYVYSVKYGYTSPLGFELPYGKYGVQLFFMLSGFVNAMTLLKKRKSADFLAGRVLRILPSYWLVLVINLLIGGMAPLAGSALWTQQQIAANFTVMPELFGYQCMEPVTWTLSIEILFYGLILLMFLTGALESPFRTMMSLMVLSAVTCGSINYLSAASHDPMILSWMMQARDLMILEYLPLFSMGILLNEIRNRRGNVWCNGLGILVSAAVFHAVDRYNHNPAATLVLFGLLAFSAYGRVPMLRFKPLVFVSTISYMLYLLHNNLGCVFIFHVNQAGLSPLASMILGIVLYDCSFIAHYVLPGTTTNPVPKEMLVAVEYTSSTKPIFYDNRRFVTTFDPFECK